MRFCSKSMKKAIKIDRTRVRKFVQLRTLEGRLFIRKAIFLSKNFFEKTMSEPCLGVFEDFEESDNRSKG